MFDFLGCHSDHINGLCGLSWLFSLPVLLERPVTFTGSEAVSEICSPSDCHRTISSSSTKPLNHFSKARCGSGRARGSQDCRVGPGPDCHPQRVAGGRGLEGPRGTIWWHSPAEAWPESSVRQSPWEGVGVKSKPPHTAVGPPRGAFHLGGCLEPVGGRRCGGAGSPALTAEVAECAAHCSGHRPFACAGPKG